MEKCLILGQGQEIDKISLVHLVVPETKAVLKGKSALMRVHPRWHKSQLRAPNGQIWSYLSNTLFEKQREEGRREKERGRKWEGERQREGWGERNLIHWFITQTSTTAEIGLKSVMQSRFPTQVAAAGYHSHHLMLLAH